jgi:hypothetical protein
MSLLLLFGGGAAPDLWTADADHFTVDDNTNHTADGWHDDGAGATLALDAGSYTVTGNATGLTAQRKLTFDAGSYTVTGNALGLTVQRTLGFDVGSYTVTGNAAGLTVQRKLTFDAGSYTVTGNALGLTAQRKLTFDAGSYTVTGNDLTLTYAPNAGYTLNLDAGSYTVTGNATGLTVQRKLTFDAGSYTVTGNALGLTAQRTLALAAGSYTVTGNAVGLTAQRTLALAKGTYTTTGINVRLTAVQSTAGVVPDFDIKIYHANDVQVRQQIVAHLEDIYNFSLTFVLDDLVATAADTDYVIWYDAPYAGTVNTVRTKTSSGTCTVTGKINTTALGGTANSASTVAQEKNHTSSNTFVKGDVLKYTVSGNAAALNLAVTFYCTRT